MLFRSPSAQQVLDHCWEPGPNKTFSDLWRDDSLQATSKVAHWMIRWLNLKLYSCAIFKWGLKARSSKGDGEESEVLDRAMEYARVVGLEVANMLASVNKKVWAIEPCVPTQHTFGGDSLQNFIHDHQDRLERLEDQLGDLVMMTNHVVGRLLVANEVQGWLIDKLLIWVMALEGTCEDPIMILDSPALILVPPPGLGPGSEIGRAHV